MGCLAAFSLTGAAHAQEWYLEGSGYFVRQAGSDKVSLSNSSTGYSLGLGYQHYLNRHWSLGLGLSYTNGEFSYRERSIRRQYTEVDLEGDQFEFRYQASSFSERVHWRTLNIPLTIQYQTEAQVQWYIRTGVSYGLQLGNATYRLGWRDLRASGYYPQWDAELHGPEFVGFGFFGDQDRKDSMRLKNRISWVLETGVKQNYSTGNSLYLGLFLELGLNDMRPKKEELSEEISYTHDVESPLSYPSVWNQSRFKDAALNNFTFGLRMRYAFGR